MVRETRPRGHEAYVQKILKKTPCAPRTSARKKSVGCLSVMKVLGDMRASAISLEGKEDDNIHQVHPLVLCFFE